MAFVVFIVENDSRKSLPAIRLVSNLLYRINNNIFVGKIQNRTLSELIVKLKSLGKKNNSFYLVKYNKQMDRSYEVETFGKANNHQYLNKITHKKIEVDISKKFYLGTNFCEF